MGEEMGADERTKAELDLSNVLFTLLEARGIVLDTKDVTTLEFFLKELVPIIFLREKGYHDLFNSLLEGDFHLESDRSIEALGRTRRKSLFIPMYSIKRIKGSVIIERSIERDGYIIRRTP
jgi:hypothetical protein